MRACARDACDACACEAAIKRSLANRWHDGKHQKAVGEKKETRGGVHGILVIHSMYTHTWLAHPARMLIAGVRAENRNKSGRASTRSTRSGRTRPQRGIGGEGGGGNQSEACACVHALAFVGHARDIGKNGYVLYICYFGHARSNINPITFLIRAVRTHTVTTGAEEARPAPDAEANPAERTHTCGNDEK